MSSVDEWFEPSAELDGISDTLSTSLDVAGVSTLGDLWDASEDTKRLAECTVFTLDLARRAQASAVTFEANIDRAASRLERIAERAASGESVADDLDALVEYLREGVYRLN